MGKTQKTVLIISGVIIIILAVVLGVFLWKEGQAQESAVLPQESQQQEPEEEERQWELSEEEPETYQEEQDMLAAQEPEIEEISMFFTGDVMLSDGVRSKYDANGIDGILSQYLQDEMNQANFTMINEEFPFSTRGQQAPDKQFTFRINPSYVNVFGEMGVDVVTLANNHALDYGTDALLDTFATLDEAGIPYVGAGETKERAAQPTILEYQGRTIGVLAASRVIPVVSWNIDNQQPGLFCTYDSVDLEAAIEEAKEQCDYVVVLVHWGVERQEYPEGYQQSLGKAYIDAGADLVVGSHPHVPQGIEYYMGKPIVYSLGNFIFNPSSVSTYALKVIWGTTGETSLQVVPVAAADALTSELEGQAAADMFDYLESISYDITIDENGMVTPQ